MGVKVRGGKLGGVLAAAVLVGGLSAAGPALGQVNDNSNNNTSNNNNVSNNENANDNSNQNSNVNNNTLVNTITNVNQITNINQNENVNVNVNVPDHLTDFDEIELVEVEVDDADVAKPHHTDRLVVTG